MTAREYRALRVGDEVGFKIGVPRPAQTHCWTLMRDAQNKWIGVQIISLDLSDIQPKDLFVIPQKEKRS